MAYEGRENSLSFASLLVLLTVSFSANVHAQTAVVPRGDGLTWNTAYQISELGNLVWMGDTVSSSSGKYYRITGDIDASSTANWNDKGTDTGVKEGLLPIGSGSHEFKGTLDGGGHAIRGVSINRPDRDLVGLIGKASQAVIRNLEIRGGAVRGGSHTGALLGEGFGTFTNCYSSCPVTGGGYVGGLIGIASGTFTNCRASGAVAGGGTVGGLMGYGSGTFRRCRASGSVTAGGLCVGGLIGEGLAELTDCCACGAVIGDSFVGGLLGDFGTGSSITRCFATGSVAGNDSSIGGLIGGGYATITNCYATGRVSASSASSVGGLAGWNYGPIRNCYATGRVRGASAVGGLVGSAGYNGLCVVTNSFWDKEATGQTSSVRGGEGKTSAEMRQRATFTNWDFTRVWDIAEGQDYPFLRGFSDQDQTRVGPDWERYR